MPTHSTPSGLGPCWHCQWFAGMTAQDTAAVCDNPVCCRIRSAPGNGCSDWQRVPGVDDEPGPPPKTANATDLRAGEGDKNTDGYHSTQAL